MPGSSSWRASTSKKLLERVPSERTPFLLPGASTTSVMLGEAVKCVVVGDENVGKTAAIVTLVTNAFPNKTQDSACDTHRADMIVDGRPVIVELYDTAGAAVHDTMRPLAYPGTNVFVVTFSVSDRETLAHTQSKWMPEILQHNPDPIVVLMGLKTDTRVGVAALNDATSITSLTDGQAVAKLINAQAYVECSALTSRDSVVAAFEEVARAVIGPHPGAARTSLSSLQTAAAAAAAAGGGAGGGAGTAPVADTSTCCVIL